MIKLKGYDLYLLGMCSSTIDHILSYLRANDMVVKGILCSDKLYNEYDGIPVIKVDELANIENAFLIVTNPNPFLHMGRRYQIYHRFVKKMRRIMLKKKYGAFRYYIINPSELEIICGCSEYYQSRKHYYIEHMSDLEQTYNLLYDELSRETMVEFIRLYLQSGFYGLEECDGRNKYFVGRWKKDGLEYLYDHKEDEVWLNCGAAMGDSIFLYFSEGFMAKKIYAFEGSGAVYQKLCKNIGQLPDKLLKIVVPVNEFITEKTNWNRIIQEKITLINADIEGSELALLHTVRERIRRDRPVLAICVYHRNEDLIEIPRFISEIVEGYTYILRKYPCNAVSNPTRASELVLYAIPNERCILS